MKTVFLAATMFVSLCGKRNRPGKITYDDPLTGLPLIPATDPEHSTSYNEPTQMPDAQVCKSK